MKTFDFNSLNKKALAKITVINHVVRNHKDDLKTESGFILPLCKESSGDISASDFEELFGTFAEWYFNQIGENINFAVSEFEVGNISTEVADKVKYATYRVFLSATKNVFERVDTPKSWLKRSNSPKSENMVTDENTPSEENSSDDVAPTSNVVSPSEELNNEEKAFEQSVKNLNAEIDADNIDIYRKTINSYADMIGDLFGDDSNKNKLVEMLTNFATTILQ